MVIFLQTKKRKRAASLKKTPQVLILTQTQARQLDSPVSSGCPSQPQLPPEASSCVCPYLVPSMVACFSKKLSVPPGRQLGLDGQTRTVRGTRIGSPLVPTELEQTQQILGASQGGLRTAPVGNGACRGRQSGGDQGQQGSAVCPGSVQTHSFSAVTPKGVGHLSLLPAIGNK